MVKIYGKYFSQDRLPEDGSMSDPKHVGVKEFYKILMYFLISMCMSLLLLTLILWMHASTMKLN